MSAEHPNEVDPLPPLLLLSSVVEPSQGSQLDVRGEPYQQQRQVNFDAAQRSQQLRQQHAARQVPDRGAAGASSPNAAAAGYTAAGSTAPGVGYAAAGSSAAAAAAAGGYISSSSRTASDYSGLALSSAAAAGAHASSSFAAEQQQQQQRFSAQQQSRPHPALRISPVSLPPQQGSVPPQQHTTPAQTPQFSSAAPQHSSLQQGGSQPLQDTSPQQHTSPEQSSPTGTDGSGNGDQSSGSTHSNRLPDSPEGPDIVKVSHRSRISAVAGKIAHDVRDGRLPRVMVVGNPSIANATKAIAQARRYLRPEGMDIAFTPRFRTEDHSRALLELSITLMPIERGTAADNLAQLDNAGGHEARIAGHSRHARVGSSTARQLSSRGICVLCSVGNEALANSVMATAHAACFLADTGRQMVVQPTHVVLRRDNGRGLHRDLHSYKLVVMFAN